MGLHVSSVAQIANAAPELKGIEYFVYILDYYRFSDGLMEGLTAELPVLEEHFNRLGNALLITSIGNVDFFGDVLSWHQVVGMNPEDTCPAIFISTLPPSYFQDNREAVSDNVQYTDEDFELTGSIKCPWIILKLGDLCESKEDVIKVLKSIISDISNNKPIRDFEYTGTHSYQDRPIISGKLKLYGVELDHNALISRAFKWFSNRF